jgi:hypothetical protein
MRKVAAMMPFLPKRPATNPTHRFEGARILGSLRRLLAFVLGALWICATAPGQATQSGVPLLVADFNHDGIPDVLIPSTTNATATVSLGSVPYGTFGVAKGVTFPAACGSLTLGSLVAADFNGDGLLDLAFVCGDTGGTAGVMLGNGDGSFGAAALTTGVYGTTLLAADFNQDGRQDLVVIGAVGTVAGNQGIEFFAGKGDGTFAAPVSMSFTNNSLYSAAVAVDLNGDGYPDLALGNFHSDGAAAIDVYGNNQDGTFGIVSSGGSSINTYATVQGSGSSNDLSILTGNIFGATGTDLVVPDSGSNPGFFLVRNTSTGTTFSLASAVKMTVGGLQGGMAGRVTGSGFTDLITANGANLVVLTNDGTGNFTANYGTLTLASSATQFAVADANGDGYADVYTATPQSSGPLQLAVNLVSGSATATSQPFSLPAGSQPISAVWAGNMNFSGSTATGTQIVNGVPTTTSVTSSKNPSLVDDSVTLTAIAAPTTETANLPSGMMTLMDGETMLAFGVVDATGTFTYTTTALAQGTHSIQAVYTGDSYFAGSTSAALSQVVNHAAAVAPTLTWATPTPISYGTPLGSSQLNAVATDATGAAVPGIYVYTPPAGTILGAGSQTLSVTFTPNDLQSFTTAMKSVSLTVLQATPSTTLAVTSGADVVKTVVSGTVVTLTAKVTSADSVLTVGQVKFCDASAAYCTDIHLLGIAQLTPAGTASFRFVPGVGSHTYKAVFTGTKNSAGAASDPAPLTVSGKYATATTLAQSGTTGNYTLTATTAGTGTQSVAPTGVISFLNQTAGGSVLATASLGTGVAGLTFASVTSSAGIENPQTRGAVGDFNGDGILDIATANSAPDKNQTVYANTVTISLGNGDGTFRTSGTGPSTGTQPEAIVTADFNGDGILDLATTNAGNSTLTILLGNGDGTFKAAATPATASGPLELVAADFNGDGIDDLAVAGESGYTILLGNGDGTFTAIPMAETSGSFAAIVSADFNGDGKPDLAILNYYPSNQLILLLGNGDGTFTQGSGIPQAGTGSNLNSLAVGDFNGDGKIDLALTNSGNDTVSILMGNGDGTFTQALAASATGKFPEDVQVADFNGDGKLDLAVINLEGNPSETVLLGNGDGTFTIPAIGTGVPAYDAVAVGDFNGDGVPDLLGTDGSSTLYAALTLRTQTVTATAVNVAPTGTGTVQVVASYPGDASFGASISAPTTLNALQTMPVLTWTPAVPSIVFGTALGPQQLDASAADALGNPISGVFTYLPAAGAVLTAGPQTLTVTFVPTDTRFLAAKGTASITVTQATPVLTWATPAGIAYGTPLGAGQLDATVAGVTGAALPGTLTYTPAAGTVLTPGTQTLSVAFTPTDAVDYVGVSGSVKLVVTGVTLTALTPNTAVLGDGNKTITLTGAGFVATSVVQVNGAAIATTLVSPTTLMAVVPAADFTQVGTLQITVADPTVSLVSSALPLTVAAAAPAVTVTAPPTTPPGSQPSISFSLTNPYPVPLTAVFTITFASSVTPATDDPAIQFATGGRTFTLNVPANSTAVPPILLQSGTVAGAITVSVALTAGGTNVTPTTLQPVTITIPPAIPTVSTATLTRSGTQLTVAIHGFSNTREVTQASFHFVGIAGAQINTPDITAPVTPLFTGWFSSTTSAQYGSTFTYTQIFNVSDNANNIGSVEVTLTNSVGVSTVQTAQ